jgi:hypothetical protein
MHSFSLILIMKYFELYYILSVSVLDAEIEIKLEFEVFIYPFDKLDMNIFTKIWLAFWQVLLEFLFLL